MLYAAAGGSFTDFFLKGVYGAYEGREIKDVEGEVRIDDHQLSVAGLKGNSGKSSFENVLLRISPFPVEGSRPGSYSVDFRDVASEINRDGFILKEGTLSGAFLVEGKSGAIDYGAPAA